MPDKFLQKPLGLRIKRKFFGYYRIQEVLSMFFWFAILLIFKMQETQKNVNKYIIVPFLAQAIFKQINGFLASALLKIRKS